MSKNARLIGILVLLVAIVVGLMTWQQGKFPPSLFRGELYNDPEEATMLAGGCKEFCDAGDPSNCGTDSAGFPCNWCDNPNRCKACIRAGERCHSTTSETCCPHAYADGRGGSLSCGTVNGQKRCCLPDGAECEGLSDNACCSGDCDDRLGFTDKCDDSSVSAVETTTVEDSRLE